MQIPTVLSAIAAILISAPLTACAQPASPYTAAGQPPAGLDRTAAQHATETHLKNLIRLDTRNPPGNEMKVARYLDSVFRGMAGVETTILDVGQGRANFIARVRATHAAKPPVLIMAHMDVVGADSTKWTTPPFEPTVRDNYLYGRGAIDDKGMLAAAATAVTALVAQRDALTRDIIFLGTASEEGGDLGIDWVVANKFDLIKDAEFALNEGGRIRVKDGRVQTVNIQTTEKVPYNVVATAKGPSGHGSVPLPDNALAALARAVSRVHEWKAPVRLNETTRLYFAKLAEVEKDAAMKSAMQRISAPNASQATIDSAAAVLSKEPLHNAVLRTGQSLTLMNGGIRVNVIPSEGTANFNVRTLPADDITQIVKEMQRAGAEPQVTFELQEKPEPAPPPSPVSTALYVSMEQAAKVMAPQSVVIPFMSTGATDGALLRAKGIPTYGILPMPLPVEDELRMHGDNERVPVPALGWAAEYLYRVLVGVVR
jgi:acetylornithine deacetylase/succinyl-diaminopimelate desuccinylase-like protein